MSILKLLRSKFNVPGRNGRLVVLIPLLCLLILAGLVDIGIPATFSEASEKHSGAPAGFLSAEALPDGVTLLPPPPAPGSAAFAADEEAYHTARTLRGTPRWDLAIKDADLSFPQAMEIFACALGTPITKESMPHLYDLMLRTRTDAGRSNGKTKSHYRRIRPFVFNKETSCTPAYEPALSGNGSYPSGHAAIGWAWALILAEIAPHAADAVLARGYAYGQSRVVCSVHWQSDVDAARTLAAAVVARLHADPSFRAQLEVSRSEFAAARAKSIKPARDCKREAAALAIVAPRKHTPVTPATPRQ